MNTVAVSKIFTQYCTARLRLPKLFEIRTFTEARKSTLEPAPDETFCLTMHAVVEFVQAFEDPNVIAPGAGDKNENVTGFVGWRAFRIESDTLTVDGLDTD